MLHGVSTLLTRSMRMEANWLRTHLYRLVFVFIIYLMMMMAQVQSLMMGAPGLAFFGQMLFLNAAFITLGGIGFFATAITEEKEEDTIGLLMMAGISPVSLLLGKSTSRLLQALLLLAIQLPFTLLAITLGGVLLNQVVSAYAALLAFTILFANVGLLASVVSRRSGTAMGLSVLFLLAYSIIPPLLPAFDGWLVSEGLWSISTTLGQSTLDFMANSNVWTRLSAIYSSTFADSPWSAQVLSNLLGAVSCFLLSWALFSHFALRGEYDASLGRLVSRPGTKWRRFSAGRAWSLPLVWKDYHFLAGGHYAVVLKLIGYGLLIVAALLATYVSGNPFGSFGEALSLHLSIMLGLLVISTSILASRIFHDEIRDQTMVNLLVLPRSIGYVAYSKVLGGLIGVWPEIFWIGIDLTLIPDGWTNAVEVIINPGFWTFVLILSAFIHLTVLLSLFIRWGALPIAFFITLMSTYCCPIVMLPFIFFTSAQGDDISLEVIMIALVWVMNAVSAFLFQMMIHARLYELGTK